jgi:hypothetical protein
VKVGYSGRVSEPTQEHRQAAGAAGQATVLTVFKHSVIGARYGRDGTWESERLVSLKMLDPIILYIFGAGIFILALGMAAIDRL